MTCKGCGQALPSREGLGRPRIWCSRSCRLRTNPPKTIPGNRHRMRDCEVCQASYRPTYSDQRTCGRACGVELNRRNCTAAGKTYGGRSPRVLASRVHIRNCDECSKPFVARFAHRKRCSPECQYSAITTSIANRYRNDPAFRDRVISAAQNRRASKLGIEQITTQAQLVAYLTKRDRGRCGICHKPVRAATGPMRPSIDHVVPLSRGGLHELSNVQLAHFRCNLSKNNAGDGEQLLLIG